MSSQNSTVSCFIFTRFTATLLLNVGWLAYMRYASDSRSHIFIFLYFKSSIQIKLGLALLHFYHVPLSGALERSSRFHRVCAYILIEKSLYELFFSVMCHLIKEDLGNVSQRKRIINVDELCVNRTTQWWVSWKRRSARRTASTAVNWRETRETSSTSCHKILPRDLSDEKNVTTKWEIKHYYYYWNGMSRCRVTAVSCWDRRELAKVSDLAWKTS